MAFVLVQHLAPDHKSMLGELVRRYAKMQVHEVEDGMLVEPNHAYIIPPNRAMALEGGRLRLFAPSEPRGHRLPIDSFFRSLAREQHERAICIVLSGSGSDGTLGVRAVKGEGGMYSALRAVEEKATVLRRLGERHAGRSDRWLADYQNKARDLDGTAEVLRSLLVGKEP